MVVVHMKSETKTITMTEDDIEKGEVCEKDCPLAIAIRRATGCDIVFVDPPG